MSDPSVEQEGALVLVLKHGDWSQLWSTASPAAEFIIRSVLRCMAGLVATRDGRPLLPNASSEYQDIAREILQATAGFR